MPMGGLNWRITGRRGLRHAYRRSPNYVGSSLTFYLNVKVSHQTTSAEGSSQIMGVLQELSLSSLTNDYQKGQAIRLHEDVAVSEGAREQSQEQAVYVVSTPAL